MRREAASCRACPLWKDATPTVFGEGPPDAEIMLVGEQPGDREDHPSALLRLRDEDKRSGYAAFVNDLRLVERLAEFSTGEAKPGVRAAG